MAFPPGRRGNIAATRAAANRARQHHAVIAGNLQRQRQAQANLTARLAAAVAAEEGIVIEGDSQTLAASISRLSPEQRRRLAWHVLKLIVVVSAFAANEPARTAFSLTDILIHAAELLALLIPVPER